MVFDENDDGNGDEDGDEIEITIININLSTKCTIKQIELVRNAFILTAAFIVNHYKLHSFKSKSMSRLRSELSAASSSVSSCNF